MSAEEKLKLIEIITRTDDEVLLDEIGRVLEVSSSEKVYELSEKQLKAIQVAEDQIKYGEVMTDAEAKKETSKWFEK